MQTHHLSIQKTAKICTLGDLNKGTKAIWIVCHGYGQLAQYFIRKFSTLADKDHFVIAPEALSRFYLEGFSGRVGATWMTREEREFDIQDNVNYLNNIYRHFDLESLNIPLHVLGFSQGVATVCRWVVKAGVNCDSLILWAGIFPPDLNTDFEFSIEYFQNKKVFIVYGTKDQFLRSEHLEEIEKFKHKHSRLEVMTFNGGHEIDEEVLELLFTKTSQPL